MKRHLFQLLLAGVLYAALAAALLWNWAALRPYEKPETEAYPATDWVVWADGADGVTAKAVLPPALQNPNLHSYIQTGDRLKTIDYQPVYNAEMAAQISRNATPGTVFLYQLERTAPNGFGAETVKTFVVSAYRPPALPAEDPYLWRFALVFALGLGVSALLLALILAPFLQANFGRAMPIFLFLGVTLLFAFVVSARFLQISFDYSFQMLAADRVFTFIQYAVWAAAAVSLASFSLPQDSKRLPALAAAAGAVLLYLLFDALWIRRQFAVYEILFAAAFQVFYLIPFCLLFLKKAEDEKSKAAQAVRLALAVGGILAAGWAFAQLFILDYGQTQALNAAVWLSLLYPVVRFTRSVVIFGKVSLIVTRSFYYFSAFVFSTLYYFLIYTALANTDVPDFYKGLIILLSLSVFVYIGRFFYQKNEMRLRKYFVSQQQEREERMNRFIQSIPRYTHSEKLLHDVRPQLTEFLNAEFCWIWLNNQPLEQQEIKKLTAAQLEAVYNELAAKNAIWTRAKELSKASFAPALEEALLQSAAQFILPLRISTHSHGLLIVSRKRKGVLNLTEVDIVARLAQQIQLTLEILHLLEKEKFLMQETLEAQLKALRSQINPHFLFNTFNTISDLIHTSPEQAEEAIIKLSFIFRYTLKQSNENFVRIADEMSLIRAYLELESLRFGPRLNFSINVEPSCNDTPLPAFFLQTLVENCIKHGVAKILDQGVVQIDVYRDQNQDVVCRVFDNGPGIDPARILKSSGLKNITSRAAKIYNRPDLFAFTNTGSGTEVVFRIPANVAV